MANRPTLDIRIGAQDAGGADALREVRDLQGQVRDEIRDTGAEGERAGRSIAGLAQGFGGLSQRIAQGASSLQKYSSQVQAVVGAVREVAGAIRGEGLSSVQQWQKGLDGVTAALPALGPWGMAASIAVQGVTAAIDAMGDSMRAADPEFARLDAHMQAMDARLAVMAKSTEQFQRALGAVGLDAGTARTIFSPAQLAALREAQENIDVINQSLMRLHREEEQGIKTAGEAAAQRARLHGFLREEREEIERLNDVAKTAQKSARDWLQDALNASKERVAQYEREELIRSAIAQAARRRAQAERAKHNSEMARMAVELIDAHEAAEEASRARELAAWQRHFQSRVDAALKANREIEFHGMNAIRAFSDTQYMRGLAQAAETYAELTRGVQEYGDAAMRGFSDAAASALLFGGSLKEALNQQLQQLALRATSEAIAATAQGLGYLAAGLFGFGPGMAAANASFAAAATWGVIAAGSAGATAATGGFSGAGAGAGGGAPIAPSARDTGAAMAQSAPRQDFEREIVVNLSAGSGRPLSRHDAQSIFGAFTDMGRGRRA